jgi:hypothetical protein
MNSTIKGQQTKFGPRSCGSSGAIIKAGAWVGLKGATVEVTVGVEVDGKIANVGVRVGVRVAVGSGVFVCVGVFGTPASANAGRAVSAPRMANKVDKASSSNKMLTGIKARNFFTSPLENLVFMRTSFLPGMQSLLSIVPLLAGFCHQDF